jgi:hypothetical protein
MKEKIVADGIDIAINVLKEMIGKRDAKKFLKHIVFDLGDLPDSAYFDIPESGWMGFACHYDDSTVHIFINADQHKAADEIALTIGHEFAHAFEWLALRKMRHSSAIFKTFRNAYCAALGFTKKSF